MARIKWLPLCGIAFVVFAVVPVVALGGSTPGISKSGADIASFYDSHVARQSAAALFLAAAAPLLVIFAVHLARALRGSGASSSTWPAVLAAGAAATAAVLVVTAAVHFALTDAGNHGVAGDGIRALNALDADSWVAWNAALGVMMLGVAGSILAGARLLSRWHGWLALVIGIALFIPFADFIALLLTLVWILVVSVLLWRSPRTADVPASVPT